MRTIPIAVAALALLGTAASAQTTPPARSPTSPAPSTAQPTPPPPAVNPLTQDEVSKIEGTSVYGSDDTKIGHITEILVDPQSKKIDRLVVAAGGVMGIGGHRVAMPLDKFSWDERKGGFKISETAASVKAMPEWVEGAFVTGSSRSLGKEAETTGTGDNDRTR
jgi:sporulation protein YlmC with PRC-barrel domain